MDVPRLCCFQALLVIGISLILLGIEPVSPEGTARIFARNLQMARRIWMFHQLARRMGLLLFHHYPTALMISYICAAETKKTWILDLLNELQGRNPATYELWTEEAMGTRCLWAI